MKLIKFDNQSVEGFGSYELKEEAKRVIQENGIEDYTQLAYTSYGGDILQQALISYIKDTRSELINKTEAGKDTYILHEATIYQGENMYIIGKLAIELVEASEDYALGFEDIEEYFLNMEYEEKKEILSEVLEHEFELDIEDVDIYDMVSEVGDYINFMNSFNQPDYNEEELKLQIDKYLSVHQD